MDRVFESPLGLGEGSAWQEEDPLMTRCTLLGVGALMIMLHR